MYQCVVLPRNFCLQIYILQISKRKLLGSISGYTDGSYGDLQDIITKDYPQAVIGNNYSANTVSLPWQLRS